MKTYEDCVSFHGHSCPGLAIGYRAAKEAMNILDIDFSSDEDIVCVTENDACGVDGMQVMLGTSAGKGNLITKLRGKQAFSVYNRNDGTSVRLVLKDTGSKDLSREERISFILNEPLDNVFEIKETTFVLPEKARLFNSIKCDKCGELTAEHLMRLQNGDKVCLDCFEDYTRTY